MLSVEESARILGISGARVRKLISEGDLRAVKIGRAWALEEESVMNRLAEKPTGGRPAVKVNIFENEQLHDSTQQIDRQIEELHGIYETCKEVFRRRPSASCILAAQSREEASFYMLVGDFFLKQRQSELVKTGVY